MMRNLKYTAAFAATLLFALLPVACTDDPAEETGPTEQTQQSGDLSIRWDVKGVMAPSNATRVPIGMIPAIGTRPANPADPGYFVTLEEACAAPLKEGSGSSGTKDYDREAGFAIGLFGDYTYTDTETGETKTVYDFYRGTRLVYLPPESPAEGENKPLSYWDTNVATKYWQSGAEYIFRAYYPQRLYNYTVSTSNATTLALVYPSRKLQYDLLLGVTPVDTNAEGWSGKDAVELQFQHALAALRFQFKLNFEDADFLTSVYLCTDNDEDDIGPDEETNFFSQGMVVFGDKITDDDKTDEAIKKKRESIQWLKDYSPPATEVLYKWVPPLKYWYGKKNEAGVFVEQSADEMLEEWGWVDGKPQNIPLDLGSEGYNPVLMYSTREIALHPGESNTSGGENTVTEDANAAPYTGKIADAYYGTEQYYDLDTKTWETRPSADPEVAYDGALYCRNSGWLLIPPQESFGTLNLCFTTKKGGKTLYKVRLPKKTGTKLKADGTLITESTDGTGSTGDTGGTDAAKAKNVWAAGKRYTYLVTIRQSDLSIAVSVKDWNERKHSTEIVF